MLLCQSLPQDVKLYTADKSVLVWGWYQSNHTHGHFCPVLWGSGHLIRSADRLPQCINAYTCMCHLQPASRFIPHHSYFCQHYKSDTETMGQQGFLVPGTNNQIMNFKKSVCFTVIYFLGIKNFELVECRKLISYLKYSLFSPLDSATCGSCTIHTPKPQTHLKHPIQIRQQQSEVITVLIYSC